MIQKYHQLPSFNSNFFDFHEGWIYVLGVGVVVAMSLQSQRRAAIRAPLLIREAACDPSKKDTDIAETKTAKASATLSASKKPMTPPECAPMAMTANSTG